MTDEIKELKKEIIRLKSLNRRAADEIRDLDDTIIKITKEFPEAREFLGWKDDDLWAGEASINLLNRLDGKTNGGYIENYDDLHLEMKTLDGYAQIDHPDFYVSKNVREHNLQMLQEVAELTKLYSEGKYFQFLEGTKDLTPEQLVEVAPLLKPAMQKLRKQDDPDFHQNQEHPPECKWHKDWHACDCGAFDNGGNTPERVEEQIERLKKVAKKKEIDKMAGQVKSAATKAIHKVAEQHREAFEKLAENKEDE